MTRCQMAPMSKITLSGAEAVRGGPAAALEQRDAVPLLTLVVVAQRGDSAVRSTSQCRNGLGGLGQRHQA